MESFEELLKTTILEAGQGVVKGIVVRKTKDGILVDLKSKAEKFIPKSDFLFEEWESLKEGDEINVFVDGGRISYSDARKLVAMEEISNCYNQKIPVKFKVNKKVKGGYLLDYKGLEVFLPLTLSGRDELKKDDIVEGIVKNIEEDGKKIIGSVVDYQKILRDRAINDFFEKKQIGEIVEGSVKNIIEKGIFVEVDGVDCFVPFSELTYKRIKSPGDIFSVGQKVKGKIIDKKREDRKITLSIKALEEDPWNVFIKNYKVNDRIKGIVRNIIDKGIFVEVGDGIDGFLHVSEISWTERVKNPKQFFKIGDYVECIIKKIDNENKKVSLSFRELMPNPWEEFLNQNKIGSVMDVKIKKIVEPGLILELSDGLEGFVPNENISWKYIDDAKKMLKEGDEIKVKLIAGDVTKRRLVFSIKDLTDDPWEIFSNSKKEGDEIEGTVRETTDKLIIVQIEPYIEGVVKKSEFQRDRREEMPKVGDKMTFMIKEIDNQKKRVMLSYVDLIKKKDAEALEELKKVNTSKVTLGDFFK